MENQEELDNVQLQDISDDASCFGETNLPEPQILKCEIHIARR